MNTEYENINSLHLAGGHPNVIDTDYKAEVIASNLVEQGYDPEQIVILRKGDARRRFSKDVEGVAFEFYQHDLRDYLYVHVNKEGIYDSLPEGLFHGPVFKKLNKDKEEILEEVRIHREQEFFARKFFHLFESEIDHALILANLFEIKFNKKISNRNFVDIFLPYWPVLRLLELEQAILFMHSIPLLHNIRDNFKEIEKSLSLILDVPVNISKIKLPAKESNDCFESSLGNCYLGSDFVLGKVFDDGEYDIKITIGPISSKKMEHYIETATGQIILDSLCLIFLPGNDSIVKEFEISPEDAQFRLSDENHIAFLGINTFI